VAEAGRAPRKRRMKKCRGRGTLAEDKPPIFGIVNRKTGLIALFMCMNVKKCTIKPIVEQMIPSGNIVNTDEYNIYHWMRKEYDHSVVYHKIKEYARDEDRDGINEIHTNTIESVWSHMKTALRVHRGISQKYFPAYLDFFVRLYNYKRRGEHIFTNLLKLIFTP
jgi:transposase